MANTLGGKAFKWIGARKLGENGCSDVCSSLHLMCVNMSRTLVQFRHSAAPCSFTEKNIDLRLHHRMRRQSEDRCRE